MESFNLKPFELQEWIKVMFERLDSAASVLALFQMTNPSADNSALWSSKTEKSEFRLLVTDRGTHCRRDGLASSPPTLPNRQSLPPISP